MKNGRRPLHNFGAEDMNTIVLQFYNEATDTNIDGDLHWECDRGFKPDQCTEVFEGDVLLLLNIYQVAKRSENFNDGVPVPAVKWKIGNFDLVVDTGGNRMRAKFGGPER